MLLDAPRIRCDLVDLSPESVDAVSDKLEWWELTRLILLAERGFTNWSGCRRSGRCITGAGPATYKFRHNSYLQRHTQVPLVSEYQEPFLLEWFYWTDIPLTHENFPYHKSAMTGKQKFRGRYLQFSKCTIKAKSLVQRKPMQTHS